MNYEVKKLKSTDTIKVVKKIGDKIDEVAIMLPVSEIQGFRTEKKSGRTGQTRIVYITDNGEFIDETRTEQTMRLFENIEGFVRVGRGSMADVTKIDEIDERVYEIYFDKSKKSFVEIAAVHLTNVKKMLQKLRNNKK